jgi:hypothetical protein
MTDAPLSGFALAKGLQGGLKGVSWLKRVLSREIDHQRCPPPLVVYFFAAVRDLCGFVCYFCQYNNDGSLVTTETAHRAVLLSVGRFTSGAQLLVHRHTRH